MKTDRERAPMILKRTPRGLEPGSKLAADLLSKYDIGSYVEVSVKQRRSNPQNAAYWQMLQRLVDATDAFPSADHAHLAIKLDLGLTTPMKTLTGEVLFIPDSTAFSKMQAPQFRDFFDRARKLIIETYGFDPLEMEEKAA